MRSIAFILILFTVSPLYAQQDLLGMLEEEQDSKTELVRSTFKGTRLINGHSVETRSAKSLEFLISHRFGTLNSGSYNFWGLDQANIRLGLEYAFTDEFMFGVGRNSFEKTYDSFLKYRLLQQKRGGKSFPFSLTIFTSATVKTLKDAVFTEDVGFSNRLAFTHQLLLARKLNEAVSIQLMPSLVQFNAIQATDVNNDIVALGGGGRVKISNRVTLNAEYYYQFQTLNPNTFNALAIGVDIETGGHVFQLHLTNSRAMIEKGFIAETTGDFFEGDIHFGFNISRNFQFGKNKKASW